VPEMNTSTVPDVERLTVQIQGRPAKSELRSLCQATRMICGSDIIGLCSIVVRVKAALELLKCQVKPRLLGQPVTNKVAPVCRLNTCTE